MQFLYVCMFCTARAVLAQNPSDGPGSINNHISPPKDKFCFFALGEFVFEDKMKEVAPSAKLEGIGSIENVYVHVADCNTTPKNLWGAMYYISNDDRVTLEEFVYKERLTIADVRITKSGACEPVDCVSADLGLLPHAYPVSIYYEFSRDICVKDYLKRLTEIGVSQDYVTWLETLPANEKGGPPPDYVVIPTFYAPPTQRCPPPCDNRPQFHAEETPCDKFCIFTAGDLIFEKSMTKIIPSATVIGAAMLKDEYMGLGCPCEVEPDKFVKYKGFRNVWGVAYTIDKNDLNKFVKYGEEKEYLFVSEVRIVLKETTQMKCKTFDVGILPSGFPFQAFKKSKLDIDSYTERLKDVGVPSGYVESVIQIGIKLDTYKELAKNPTTYVLHDTRV